MWRHVWNVWHHLSCWTIFKQWLLFQHEEDYLQILSAVKGTDKEKRLASQFIARFFKHFPKLADKAIEAQVDLCEDQDVSVSTCWDTFYNVIGTLLQTVWKYRSKFNRFCNVSVMCDHCCKIVPNYLWQAICHYWSVPQFHTYWFFIFLFRSANKLLKTSQNCV